ncbi:MAG: flagellar basal body P-ring protein FlgI [Blastochloris viridis]|uniref:Flagellar P-ring protein n=1 Tax=Blastochloris viridis TaxID=1079 RepID=A0A6N4RD49_BLAVI|nr:MAG: flagellar basal body P-ring protein FlgI [Blastochloris viridis]
MRPLTNLIHIALVAALMLAPMMPLPAHAAANARIKDIADIEGVRENVLVGYGLIVGLAGTGDSVNAIPFTRQSLANMLERLGVNAKDVMAQIKTKNIAAVMVTAKLPSLARQGSRIDVSVSSLGDAKSLEGGMLLATPLVAADGQTYAVAQGAVVVGGFMATGKDGSTITKNHTTVARIAEGATVERETGFELSQLGNTLRFVLRQPDFTTATRLKDSINTAFKEPLATADDNARISVVVPTRYQNQMAAIIQKIENLMVEPASEARVIIDEKTGTIVMGENVRIAPVAISHANLTIKVTEEKQISQPLSFNVAGQTVVTDKSTIERLDDDPNHGKFEILDTGASLSDLVSGLNTLGVKPRDIISILQNIKAAGALQAELVIL